MKIVRFEPVIPRNGLSVAHQETLATWGMEETGEVVPLDTNPEAIAAVWHGKYSLRDEAPVLATMPHPGIARPYPSMQWFIGVALEEDIRQSDNKLEAFVDAAITVTPHLKDALDLLTTFVPKTHYPK